MLGEDSETNLGTAREYGIRHLVFVSRSSSAIAPQASADYLSIHYFSELIPKQTVF
jgi:putative hydrolase of the HAD superfamily